MNAPSHAESLRRPVPEACLNALRTACGERLSLSHSVREHHGRDESPYTAMLPDAVVFAESTDEVALVAKLCNDY